MGATGTVKMGPVSDAGAVLSFLVALSPADDTLTHGMTQTEVAAVPLVDGRAGARNVAVGFC